MKRKTILRLSFLAVLLTLLWSCRNEDLVQADKNPLRNNQDFFAHSKNSGTNARAGVDYIDLLEAYNRDRDFLSHIPDQDGMPIWEKMKIVHGENITSLMIPLSTDNATMSSIVFALIDNDGNRIKDVNNITNEELKRVVYSKSYSTEEKEGLFNTFMVMDNYAFGTEAFTNIPKDLYVEYKMGAMNNQLNFHAPQVKETDVKEQTDASGKLQVVQDYVCVLIKHCTNHGPGPCDGCASCQTQSCSHSTIFIYSYPDPSGSGIILYGYGDEGGGSGTPAVIPDPDPCGMHKAFYRLAPGCNGYEPPEPIENPCEKLKLNLQKAKAMMENTTVKAQNNIMIATILTDTSEKGMYWGQNSSGQMMTSDIINMSTNYGGIPISSAQFTPTGSAHNHNGPDLYTNFSPADITGFNATNENFPTINHTFANGADGSLYVMTIEDQLAYNDYVTQYPMSSIDAPSPSNPYGTGDWKKDLDIYKDEINVYRYFRRIKNKPENEAYDLTMGYLANKYNMGIVISKKGADGNFHPIQTESIETIDPITGEKVIDYQQINPCNL